MIATAEMDRLAARVRASARDGGLIETAKVKFLGLDEVREAGARWPRMREQVREGSLKIIAARIGADDAVIPWGDGFLVVFADATAETERRCSTALSEIDAWCRILRRQGVQPFIHGFAEAGFFDLASFSEIAFATGEALWPCQQALERIVSPAKGPTSQHAALAS